MTHRTHPGIRIDARGLHCPLPVIELSRAIEQTAVGTTVEIVSDDPSSRVDIPVWCRMKRHELLEVRDGDTAQHGEAAQIYLVRRGV